MSWKRIHNSFFVALASSRMALTIRNGSRVDPPGRPAWLPPRRIECCTITLERRELIKRTNAFLIISSKVIGLVLLRLLSQSIGFGMGYIVGSRQARSEGHTSELQSPGLIADAV